jgi:hypothetical protein
MDDLWGHGASIASSEIMVLQSNGYGEMRDRFGNYHSTFTWRFDGKTFHRGQNPGGSPAEKRLMLFFSKVVGWPTPWPHDVISLQPDEIVLRANPPRTGLGDFTLRRLRK